MTVPLHLFMKNLLVGSIDISSSSRVVMDNARIHVRPPPKHHHQQHHRKTVTSERRQQSKDIIIITSSYSSSLDVSDHSKKDSRWTSQEEQEKKQPQGEKLQKRYYNLDISDHSKKESRWSGAKKEQNMTSPSSSTATTSTSPCTGSSKLPNRPIIRSVPKKSKSLDISDHSKRDSRWASLYNYDHHHYSSHSLSLVQEQHHHHHHDHHPIGGGGVEAPAICLLPV
jgi:hypothetical protein